MGKLKITTRLTNCKKIITGIKKKVIVVITSVMLGIAIGFNANESSFQKNSKQSEWQNKKY